MRVLLRRRLVLVGWLSIVVFAAFLSAPSSAAAEPPAPANDTSSVNTPLVIDSGGVPPPVHLQSEAAAEWPIGLRPTNGPGTYDVVVAGVTTALGAPPATSANSAATITGADALWNTSVAGRYRLDYRTYVSTTVSGTTCDLEVLTNAVNSAVSTATEDGTPRPGRVGLIVVISFADDDACSSGLGWVGASGLYVNGYWGAGVGVEITAHEAGHNFRLGHSGGLGCTPDPLQYPAAQSPSWPCKADSSNEYLDLEAMMGASGLGLRPLRIPASQLQVLGILDPATAVVEVGSGVGVYDLVPPLSGATGPQTLRLDVPGTVTGGSGVPSGATVTVEYRTTTASAGGPRVFLDVAGTANPEYAPWGADTWAYRGNSANNTRGTYGMTAGTMITLADGRTVTVQSVGTTPPGSVTSSARVVISSTVEAPGAPTGLVATAGNGQASIAFVAPASTGGAPITNYEYSINDGTSWTAQTPASPNSPLVIGGLTNGTAYQVKLRAVNTAGSGAASAAVSVTPVAPPSGAVFVPSAPVRAYDSRNTGGALAKDQARVVDVKVAGYPAGTVAIAYNVTVTDTVGAGWLAVTPGDATGAPTASTINWDSPNATLANGYVVGVSPAGAVRVVAGGHVGSGTQFVIDVVGFYVPETPAAPGAVFVPVDPARAYNSITSGGPLGSGQTRNVSVAPGGVPAATTGVAYNLTVTNTSQQGWLAVTPQGTPASGSSINWTQPGQTYANGTQGQITSNAVTVTAGGGGSTDFIIDVTGYFMPVGQDGGKGTRFTPLAPVRAFDSRTPGGGGRLNSQASRTTSMTTGTGVPVGAAAVVYNLTETETASGGYLAVAPGGATTNASTINWFRTGQDMANGTVVKLNPAGQVTTTAGGGGSSGLGSTQYLIDIAGYYK